MIRVPLARPSIGAAEKQAVLDVMDSGMLVQGPRTAAFERTFAETFGASHAVATSSGTTALHLALLAAGVGPGDEVVTSAFSFIAPANAILLCGATPVFADIDPRSFNLDPVAVERAITPRTKAIVPVHLFGRACEMPALVALAAKHRLALVEDCAQAIGATFEGTPVGRFGVGAFSLYATKNVTSGEGGMILTDDATVADVCRLDRQHGARQRHQHERLGYNYRMTDLHAAIGLVQLGRLAELTAARQENARWYDQNLRGVEVPEPAPAGSAHVYHQYTVRLVGADANARDRALVRLAELGVEGGAFYAIPAHRQRHLIERGFGEIELPHTERAAREVIALPVHPGVGPAEREIVAAAVAAL